MRVVSGVVLLILRIVLDRLILLQVVVVLDIPDGRDIVAVSLGVSALDEIVGGLGRVLLVEEDMLVY